MQVKLKTGKVIDLAEEQIKDILHQYKAWQQKQFDSDKLLNYFHEMWKKAHMNLQMISEMTIETEGDMKDALVVVMKYGTRADVADYIIEAIECKVSKMIIESMK